MADQQKQQAQPTPLLKFSAHHYRAEGVDEQAFAKWYQEEQIPRMVNLLKKHGINRYKLVRIFSPCLFSSASSTPANPLTDVIAGPLEQGTELISRARTVHHTGIPARSVPGGPEQAERQPARLEDGAVRRDVFILGVGPGQAEGPARGPGLGREGGRVREGLDRYLQGGGADRVGGYLFGGWRSRQCC